MTTRVLTAQHLVGLLCLGLSLGALAACDHHADELSVEHQSGIAGSTGEAGTSGSGVAGWGQAGAGGSTGEIVWSESPDCSSDEYQIYQEHCGVDGSLSACVERPTHCYDTYNPVCGCDGVVHDNECAANLAGVGLDELQEGECTPPKGYSPCGSGFCDKSTSYCLLYDRGRGSPGYECKTLPGDCAGDASCACLVEALPWPEERCHDFPGGGAITYSILE